MSTLHSNFHLWLQAVYISLPAVSPPTQHPGPRVPDPHTTHKFLDSRFPRASHDHISHCKRIAFPYATIRHRAGHFSDRQFQTTGCFSLCSQVSLLLASPGSLLAWLLAGCRCSLRSHRFSLSRIAARFWSHLEIAARLWHRMTARFSHPCSLLARLLASHMAACF